MNQTSRRVVIALAAAHIVAVTAWCAWIVATPPFVLRGQLVYLQFWSLEACVLVGATAALVLLPTIVRSLRRIDAIAMVLMASISLGLTLGVAVRTNRIFYDEQIYQGIGQNLADLRLAEMCNDGVIEDGHLRCAIGEYNKQPYAYPHLLSIVYRAVGVRPAAAFVVNAVLFAVTVCLIYVLVLMMFADRLAAAAAAAIFALIPEQIIWSATAAVEPSASWSCVLAVLAAACFVRRRTRSTLLLCVAAATYAIQFRPESFLILVVVAAVIVLGCPEEVVTPRFWAAVLLALSLAAVPLAHLAAVRDVGWGTTGPRFSIAYVVDNLRVNGWFYLADRRFCVAWTALAVVGLVAGRGIARWIFALYFAAFFGITLFFYAGSYDYGADVRYSLSTYPPLAIAAGLGVSRLSAFLPRRLGPAWKSVLGAVLVAQFFWYLPIVRTAEDSAWAARADVVFAQGFVSNLPRNSYVLTHNPAMFHVWGVSAGQMSLAATQPARLAQLLALYPDRLFLHWNFWCNVTDPLQTGFCRTVLAQTAAQKTQETRVRDQSFVLYRLKSLASRGSKYTQMP